MWWKPPTWIATVIVLHFSVFDSKSSSLEKLSFIALGSNMIFTPTEPDFTLLLPGSKVWQYVISNLVVFNNKLLTDEYIFDIICTIGFALTTVTLPYEPMAKSKKLPTQ